MDCKDHKEGCSLDMGRGCEFCRREGETTARACEGCYKLHSTDWLEGYPDNFPDDIFEVRFKNTRRSYYRNVNNLPLKRGDIVAVEASPGHDIGIVSLTGDMVAKQMKRVGFSPQNGEFKKIYRKAKPYDIEKWQEAIALEHGTMIRSRQIAADMGLNMKIGDVEYQGDKIKAIFYYIADERVDFRELIKVVAEAVRVRIEMKQLGARQEAGRIGGIGPCGRELCCASWISNFVSVTTNSARHQEISLNPQKLAGQCGKLKCCLIYELDTYMDARREIPRINQPLQTLEGEYYLVKTDILGRTMSFSTSPNSMVGVVTLPVVRVREILEINKRGKKADRLIDIDLTAVAEEEPDFVNVIGEESITRFDNTKREGRGRNRGRGRDRGRGGNGQNDNRQSAQGQSGEAGPKPDNGNQPRGGNGKGGDRNRNNRTGGNNRQAAGNGQPNDSAASAQGTPSGNGTGGDRRPRPKRHKKPGNRGGNNPGGNQTAGGGPLA